MFLWQLGVVDTLTAIQFCMNVGAQYAGISLGQAAGNMDDIGPRVLL
jgi:hypothetical protein